MLCGVTFSGGEPFCQAKELAYLGEKIKQNYLDIITYTGYTFEELIKKADDDNCYKDLLKITDYLIDGKFVITSYSIHYTKLYDGI